MMNVWLIMGGFSAEREVSLTSGRAVARALAERGHSVWAYELAGGRFLAEESTGLPPDLASGEPSGGMAPGGGPGWAARLVLAAEAVKARAAVAFLALHGGAGENGTVQALLASAGMPYTGSGPGASAVAMDKALSKWIMEAIEVPTPPWQLITLQADAGLPPANRLPEVPALPVVVKPAAEGSSVGVTIVRERADWVPAIHAALGAAERIPGAPVRVLVEEFIAGRELTVSILGERALPVVEIRPKAGFYDYHNKYTKGSTEYRAPADLGMHESRRLQEYSLRLFQALGCRGMARVDFRFTPGAEAHCLELNTIPGLTSLSLLPMAAAAEGIEFGVLLEEICRLGGL
jgi:D-alanine-D-alanine ligase